MEILFNGRYVEIAQSEKNSMEDLCNSKDKKVLIRFLQGYAEGISAEMRQAIKEEAYGKVQRAEGEIGLAESLIFMLTDGIAEALREEKQDKAARK